MKALLVAGLSAFSRRDGRAGESAALFRLRLFLLMSEAQIVSAVEATYRRHPDDRTTTRSLLADVFVRALERAGLDHREVDGLAVASFTLAPDTAIDLAWQLGVSVRWLHQSPLGGASAIDMLQHAVRAVEGGDASTVVVLAGDRFVREEFAGLVDSYNRATRDLLAPLPHEGPNSLFALVTQRHMAKYCLARHDYAEIPIAQREWASRNPGAVYREPLTIDQYLRARMVAEPLTIYDCVPVVAGADAIVVTDRRAGHQPSVRVRAQAALHNSDHQAGDGLRTGLAEVADGLWNRAGIGPDDVDIVSVYDDYPVMVLVQLVDLGLITEDGLGRFLHEDLPRGRPVNTSGGQLSAGQAGAAGGLHGLVEAVVQLQGAAAERQVPNARRAVVTGYGMVLYRYGACASAAVLERVE
jgi:acetyl-CoA acetyltransferase